MADLVITDALEAWRERAEAACWDWAGWNCLLAAADWAEMLTGRDPAADWRGRFDNEASAMRAVRAAGGMAALAAAALEPLGWARTNDPRPGDLAVVRLLADRLMVMKDGRVVESGLTDQVLDDPQHAYTQLLVSSVLQV